MLVAANWGEVATLATALVNREQLDYHVLQILGMRRSRSGPPGWWPRAGCRVNRAVA